MEDRCCYSVFIIVCHNTQVREENLETRGDMAQVEAIYNTDRLPGACSKIQFRYSHCFLLFIFLRSVS